MVKFKNIILYICFEASKLEKDIVDPINLFYQHLGGIYQDTINEFKNVLLYLEQLINLALDSKRNLAKAKQKYFDSCRIAQEQEKLLMRIMNEKEKKRNSNDEEISFANGLFSFTIRYFA